MCSKFQMKRHLQQPRPQQNMQNTVHQTALGKLAKYEVAKKIYIKLLLWDEYSLFSRFSSLIYFCHR